MQFNEMKMDVEMSGQGIQSLELGIEILKKIGEAEKPLTISEIAEVCAISKSKLHRYLTSFCRTGFLQRNSSLQYSIGKDLITIGINATKNINIKEIAKPVLLKLRDQLNETVFLSVWKGNGPYPIDIVESNRSFTIGINVGSNTSITQTTAGRLFAAYLPEEMTKYSLLIELSKNELDSEAFYNELTEIKKLGYSITKESLVPGIVAIGCPVFGSNNEIIATISVVGIIGILDQSNDSEIIKLLKKECNVLSEYLSKY